MYTSEHGYLNLLAEIRQEGKLRADRTGIGTCSLFGRQLRFDLREGFPLLTTKKVHLKAVIHELLWFLTGRTDVGYLNNRGIHIWDGWAGETGDLGPIYGHQWRSWPDHKGGVIDQIANVISGISSDPYSRRHIVSAWNPADIPYMRLPSCHLLFQFYVDDGELFCHLYQRSADIFLGVPFNIASYALLTQMVAQVTGLRVGEFVHTFGDVHLYLNHFEQADEQLSRWCRPSPRMIIDSTVKSIDDFEYDHFRLEGYDPHPAILAPIAI